MGFMASSVVQTTRRIEFEDDSTAVDPQVLASTTSDWSKNYNDVITPCISCAAGSSLDLELNLIN